MSAAEELRRAAEVLREKGGAATPGPWEVTREGQTHPRPTAADVSGVFADCCGYTGAASTEDAAYIATVHPGVGLLLADWLETVDERHPRYVDPDGWALCGRCVSNGSATTIWPCAETGPALALALARAILRDAL